MNLAKAIVMTVFFFSANLALAESGADRTSARMEAAMERSMQAYRVAQEKKKQAEVAAKSAKHTDHESC